MTDFTEILCAVTDFFSAAEGTFVSIAAVITASVAVLGYNRWKRELVGKENLNVARNLLLAAYKVRDAIRVFRVTYFFLPYYEFPEGYDPMETDQKKRLDARMYVYNNRMKPVWAARQEFDVAKREAEVSWGGDVVDKADEVHECAKKLSSAIRFAVEDELSGGKYLENNPKFAEEMKYTVQDVPIDTPEGELENPFSKRVENAIADVDEIVRPHMPTRTNRRNRT